jgi:ABC-type multidrug transport system fused ATPase/permease subunit
MFFTNSSQFLIKSAAYFLLGSVSSWVRVYYLGTATESIANRLRVILFSSCMDKDMEFFESAKNGELISVMEKGNCSFKSNLSSLNRLLFQPWYHRRCRLCGSIHREVCGGTTLAELCSKWLVLALFNFTQALHGLSFHRPYRRCGRDDPREILATVTSSATL